MEDYGAYERRSEIMTEEFDEKDSSPLEDIESEKEDIESEPAKFEIVTYPTDFTLEGLVNKYKKEKIKAPGYQRKFVWTIKQASRLIESFLLGLPVPAIFLYTEPAENNVQLVVDGQQRLLSIYYFMEGYFGEPKGGRRTVFSLKGLNENSPYLGKTYSDLEETDEGAFNRLNDAVLRAFVIKQLDPKDDDSSVYHIFERLNTGGTQLVGQEIRNCIYFGAFNTSLIDMNQMSEWRLIFGKPIEDKRQRDVELILRFLALSKRGEEYTKPMKQFLSDFMRNHKKDCEDDIVKFKNIFEKTTKAVLISLGARPFHIRAGLNAAAFDSVYTAFSHHLDKIPEDIRKRYDALLENIEFNEATKGATTDNEIVKRRISLANQILFG